MSQITEYAVSVSGHVFWNVRDSRGRFVSRVVFQARQRAIASRARLAERRAAYTAYLDARQDKAEADTRGHLLRDWSGAPVEAILRGRASLRNATEELTSWLEENGPTLSYRDFSDQARESGEQDEYADWAA